MKKNLIYLAAALLLAACTKEAALDTPAVNGGEPLQFSAVNTSAGRTTVTTNASGLLDVAWVAEDQIGIYAKAGEQTTGANYAYLATPSEEDAARCSFAAKNEEELICWNGNKAQAFYAYYPYTEVEGALPDPTAHAVVLPAEQTQAAANSPAHLAELGVLTAAPVQFEAGAQLDGGICFEFANLFSVVEFRLKSDAACTMDELPIKALTLNSDGVHLAYPAATMDLTQSPTVVTAQQGAASVKLELAETVGLKRDAYTSFYMLVVPGTHAAQSLLLEVTAIDNSVNAVRIAEGVTFKPNKHYVREYELTLDGFVLANAFEADIPILTTKVGEPLTVQMQGVADRVDFWSGEYGHDYAYSSVDRVIKAVVKMQFEMCLVNGAQREPLSVKFSSDFNGTMTEEAILAATWTDISDEFAIPTRLGSSDTKNPRDYTWSKTSIPDLCGPVDCSKWFDNASQSGYVMFHYHVNKYKDLVHDEILNEDMEYGRTYCYLYDCSVWAEPYAGQPEQELYTQVFELNKDNAKQPYIESAEGAPTLVYGSTLDVNDGSNIINKYSYTTSEKSYPYVMRLGAAFRPTVDKDSYVVLPKITRPADQYSKDAPIVVHKSGEETPATWNYTFDKAGTYKVYVVGYVTTMAGEKKVIKEATITVTE